MPDIPTEAVEAAARAAYDRVKVPSLPSWDEQTDGAREMWRDEVCLILAAALPFLPHLAQHVSPSVEDARAEAERWYPRRALAVGFTWDDDMRSAFVAGATWATSGGAGLRFR